MKKKKIAATVAALAMAAVTAFSVGGNYAYANADIAIQTEAVSESVTLPVSVASEAWVYSDGSREFGTWKALNIKVNDTMYPLSKDGAVKVAFNNGDEIKIYSGDSYELWEGIISISGDEINVTSQNNKYTYDGHTGTTRWGCNLVYSDGSLILTKTQNHNGGGAVASIPEKIFYDYDLTAKTDAGVPIEGVSVVDEGSYGSRYNWDEMIWSGYIQKNNTWGNGNSIDLEDAEGGRYFINSKRVTNKNGVIDMYLPEEVKHSNTGFDEDIYIGGDIYAELSKVGEKRVFVNNGLVDVTINDEYYASVTSIGLNATFNTINTDEILGDYYYYSDQLMNIESNSVTLKDTSDNDIAVVTMGVKETEKQHLIGKENGNYKATGLELVADVKMADGVTDWTVSVTTDDDTFHINAVRKASESNTGDGTTSDGSTTDKYITDLSKAESQVVSLDTFASILAENATKDVIIKSNNNVTFTFAKGTMASVEGKTAYDFTTSIINTYAATMPSYITKDNFVSQINYNYSGKLPATANIRFYAGTEYAGQTLYYSLMNADNTFAEVQAVVVDADGYMTVKQDHCSSYVVTKTEPKLPDNKDTKTDDGNASNNGGASDNGNGSNNGNASASDKNTSSANTKATSPNTGDMTPIAVYVVMAAAAMGVIVLVKRCKTA